MPARDDRAHRQPRKPSSTAATPISGTSSAARGSRASSGSRPSTRTTLRRFDDAYMGSTRTWGATSSFDRVRGQDVLEIGLGFGTVGELLARAGRRLPRRRHRAGPGGMMRDRLRVAGLDGAPSGSSRRTRWSCRSPTGRSTASYTIGCLHHTGDTGAACGEVHRVLGPAAGPWSCSTTVTRCGAARSGRARAAARAVSPTTSAALASTTRTPTGEAAPHTDFVSRPEVRACSATFAHVRIDVRNFDDYPLGPLVAARQCACSEPRPASRPRPLHASPTSVPEPGRPRADASLQRRRPDPRPARPARVLPGRPRRADVRRRRGRRLGQPECSRRRATSSSAGRGPAGATEARAARAHARKLRASMRRGHAATTWPW